MPLVTSCHLIQWEAFPICFLHRLCQAVLFHTLQEPHGRFPLYCVAFSMDIWEVESLTRIINSCEIFSYNVFSVASVFLGSLKWTTSRISVLFTFPLVLAHKHSTLSSLSSSFNVITFFNTQDYPTASRSLPVPSEQFAVIHCSTLVVQLFHYISVMTTV